MDQHPSPTSTEKESPIGALWIKEGQYGKFFSMVLEINGTKESYVGFKNKFYEEGSNKPHYKIYKSRKNREVWPKDKTQVGL